MPEQQLDGAKILAFRQQRDGKCVSELPTLSFESSEVERLPDTIISSEGFAVIGLPQPERDSQMGQLLLTAKDGYSFSGATEGRVAVALPEPAGSHG